MLTTKMKNKIHHFGMIKSQSQGWDFFLHFFMEYDFILHLVRNVSHNKVYHEKINARDASCDSRNYKRSKRNR